MELRHFGDVCVRWSGDSAANMSEAVLHVLGAPATAEEIVEKIGAECTSLRAVSAALSAYDRFIRASRRAWGLRVWEIDEYCGIADAIRARIDARGGQIRVDELIDDMLSTFPDVAESSIKAYLVSLVFITDRATVRRRTDADEWPQLPPLNRTRAAFRNGDNEIRLALPVTGDLLRGSGVSIHPAAAGALGVAPGQRRLFSSPHGEVAVSWRLSSTKGASLGSLRGLALAAGAALTDTLVLAFGLDDSSAEVTRIAADQTGTQRLRRLLGRTVRNPAAALAASLGCRRADVAKVLRDRGDRELAALVDSSDRASSH